MQDIIFTSRERDIMDKKIKVYLHSTDKIRRFGQVARSFISDINIMTNSKYMDAKSILGLFDLNLYDDTYVEIISDNIDEIRRFDAVMKEFR